ncbi:hypothetical protein RclHR1_12580006 [Rhizophagus clarus]|uniref:Uncharacterized protein n=1 Tax=Rhizophagus clarus TaxID=94130 RepID=A0A2Z6QZT1_9GLOM|nr:hypothetical protein RclHR1_12580006 [Rhizophagus clarus]
MSTTSSLFAVTPTPSASVPLIITSTTNLTTDKKRDHLFDIDHVLEIPIEDFNDKSLVKIEAAKNYLPLAITSAIKEYATLELGLGEYARELRHKEVANIKYKEYRVKSYRVPQRSTKGIVFAHPEQLKKLECHRCWNVSAHFFVSSENVDTVAEALTIIRNKCCR